MRRSLRKLYPFLKMPVTGWGCGDGCLYSSILLRKWLITYIDETDANWGRIDILPRSVRWRTDDLEREEENFYSDITHAGSTRQ
jgi:hypothetical protein